MLTSHLNHRHEHNRFCCMLVVVRGLYKDRYYKTVINIHETTCLYLVHVIYCGLEICTLSDLSLYLLILIV